MSTFIQMSLSLIQLKTKSKFTELYTYFLIRSQIKNNSYITSIAEAELVDKIGVSDVTTGKYIKDLEPYFDKITTGKYVHNVYHFTYLSKDYSIVLPSLMADTELTQEQKRILIKLMCEKRH